ncbi:MAG: hypothetical protein K0R90_633 [Oscillospiraceae bacterium]|jgi:hypothetical protein|nr:hypothetical protein [Oscillospiraceae bacterium]
MSLIKFIPKVSKDFLLFLASVVWGFAGYKILGIGIPSMINNWSIPIVNILISVIIFGLFFKFVFFKMFKKHKNRIMRYQQDRVQMFAFFDLRGYIIMAFMITLGITIRNLNFINPLYLGTFYCGLGSALLGAGICFLTASVTNLCKKFKLNEVEE